MDRPGNRPGKGAGLRFTHHPPNVPPNHHRTAMTIKPHLTAWSTRKDYRPLPSTQEAHDAEDRFGCLDRSIASNNVHLDFAARCRAIVKDALKRGVATHASITNE